MPTVSVIIPVYNGSEYIEQCAQGLQMQTLSNLEIIFVDDGSKDDSLDKLRSVEAQSDNIIVLTQNNAGAGTARNQGIDVAAGEFVAFLDVDDRFANEYVLEMLYTKAKSTGAAICGGSMEKELDKTFENDDKRVFCAEGFVNFRDYQFDFGFARFIYSRKLIEENHLRFPSYRIYEDPIFMLNAMIAAKKFYAVPQIVYLYSGVHQKELNEKKTIDYILGLTNNLRLSSQYGFADLHRQNFERLISTASYYAEINLGTERYDLFSALIVASSAIDTELLKIAGVQVQEPYIIPVLRTVWNASSKYMRLRSRLPVKWFLKIKNGILFRR